MVMASLWTRTLSRHQHINKSTLNVGFYKCFFFAPVLVKLYIYNLFIKSFQTSGGDIVPGFHLLIRTNLYHQRVVFKLIGVGDGELNSK